uniref:AlNc14C9G1183 protein n=1 Tax=Albugo laibachii Nc14 TaxID=890382 RepID=F0W2D3_9STRA|nr:AlNc14C9G1183 [Albugo laibachii Nc14]|eukprot:CCA15218.1 AlNc14C9G1183 [Albugo laibachii Nc14]
MAHWNGGLEYQNGKMSRSNQRIGFISKQASLLIEFAVTGAIGASGSKGELVAYLQQIKSSSNTEKPYNESRILIPETHDRKRYQTTTKCQKDNANKCGSSSRKDRETEVDREIDEDEDELNPFTNTKKALESLPSRAPIQDTSESDVADFRKEPKVQGDSLSDFECLSRESIPEYVAFKKSTLRRKFKATQKDASTECFREAAHSLSSRQTRIGSDTVKQSRQTGIGSASCTYTDSERENAWNPFAENGEASTCVRLTAAESNSRFTSLCPN